MQGFIKKCWKVLLGYILSLMVFGIFSYFFLSVSGSKFNLYLPYFCFVTFLLAYFLIYSDMKKAAQIEKRSPDETKPHPLKGLAYGATAFSPVALLELLSAVIVFNDKLTDHAKHIAVNILMGPLYFMIRIFNESTLGYVLATLIIPLTAMLGYLAGYYKIELFGVKKASTEQAGEPFKKSPWNPTLKNPGAGRKKKFTKS